MSPGNSQRELTKMGEKMTLMWVSPFQDELLKWGWGDTSRISGIPPLFSGSWDVRTPSCMLPPPWMSAHLIAMVDVTLWQPSSHKRPSCHTAEMKEVTTRDSSLATDRGARVLYDNFDSDLKGQPLIHFLCHRALAAQQNLISWICSPSAHNSLLYSLPGALLHLAWASPASSRQRHDHYLHLQMRRKWVQRGKIMCLRSCRFIDILHHTFYSLPGSGMGGLWVLRCVFRNNALCGILEGHFGPT